jgi:hypothetical protein
MAQGSRTAQSLEVHSHSGPHGPPLRNRIARVSLCRRPGPPLSLAFVASFRSHEPAISLKPCSADTNSMTCAVGRMGHELPTATTKPPRLGSFESLGLRQECSSSARPSAQPWARPLPTVSSCTTAMPLCWRRDWRRCTTPLRSSGRHPYPGSGAD